MKYLIDSRLVVFAFAFVVASVMGCGGGFDPDTKIQELNSTNAQRLASLYSQCRRENGGKGPKNKAVFEAFIKDVNPVLLERIGVDVSDLDGLFVSERDGEPFEIRYGVRGTQLTDAQPIVFERVGVDGKRMVAFTRDKVEEVEDEAEYKRMLGKAK